MYWITDSIVWSYHFVYYAIYNACCAKESLIVPFYLETLFLCIRSYSLDSPVDMWYTLIAFGLSLKRLKTFSFPGFNLGLEVLYSRGCWCSLIAHEDQCTARYEGCYIVQLVFLKKVCIPIFKTHLWLTFWGLIIKCHSNWNMSCLFLFYKKVV